MIALGKQATAGSLAGAQFLIAFGELYILSVDLHIFELIWHEPVK